MPERVITVAVDANGADLGPREVAEGAMLAARAGGLLVKVYGPAAEIGPVGEGVEVIDAPVSIAKAADPAYAVRRTPESSIVQAARSVGDGHADALVSGGSTGSALAAGLVHMKRARGIYRPALALPLPVPGGQVLLLDVGANVECRPEQLLQFAFLGSAFAQTVMGIERPRIALLSNGEEANKGIPLVRQVHADLSARTDQLNFVGNVEGTVVVQRVADVVVMDGFTGNITLKLTEGVSTTVLRAIRDLARGDLRSKIGALLLKPALLGLRAELDPEGPGGAYMLGLRRMGVVAHGRFTRRGFARAIEVAAQGVRDDVIGRTQTALEAAGVLRPPSDAEASVGAQ